MCFVTGVEGWFLMFGVLGGFCLFGLRSGFRVLLGGIRFGSSLLLHYLVFLLLSRLRLTFLGSFLF